MFDALTLKKSEDYYTIPLLEQFGLRAVFTTRGFPVTYRVSGGEGEVCLQKRAYKKIDLSWRNLVWLSQVHGNSILVLDSRQEARPHRSIFKADALITNQPNLPLAVLTADCLPIFMFDTGNRAIALVHAGWRGLHKKIINKVIAGMSERFSTKPSNLVAALGPAIRQCCYEVGEDFLDIFPKGAFRKNSRLYLNLAEVAARQLADNGVFKERIYDSRICTHCSSREFFSYRREGNKAGRSMAIMEIK